MDIIKGILSGVVGDAFEVVADRGEAIRHAVSLARKGDTVIIAGKGHEAYQEVKGVRQDFSDVDKAAEFIAAHAREGRA